MFLKSMPTSRVTPSPNLRLEAATYMVREHAKLSHGVLGVSHLESILLLHREGVDGRGELSHLLQGLPCVVSLPRFASMTGARRMLSSVDEAANGALRCTRGHDGRLGRTSRAWWVFMRIPVGDRVDGT